MTSSNLVYMYMYTRYLGCIYEAYEIVLTLHFLMATYTLKLHDLSSFIKPMSRYMSHLVTKYSPCETFSKLGLPQAS